MEAETGAIAFHFTLRGEDGTVLETTRGGAPARFLPGAGEIIDGLERYLLSLPAGGSGRVALAPEAAYGERDETLVQRVARADLPVEDPREGEVYRTGPDRHAPIVRVVSVDEEGVVLDANHPLAGQTLIFDVERVV